jgi:hypothetical protein
MNRHKINPNLINNHFKCFFPFLFLFLLFLITKYIHFRFLDKFIFFSNIIIINLRNYINLLNISIHYQLENLMNVNI